MTDTLRFHVDGEPVPKGRARTRLSPFAPAEERFWHRVEKGPTADACWTWVGSRTPAGYGHLHIDGRPMYAHRFSWALNSGGPVPDDQCVLHRCDNPPCVRPDHLFVGTRGDNVRDAASKGRLWAQARPEDVPRGEQHAQAKLTEDIVRKIRERVANGESQRAMSREYGVDRVAIRNVVLRKTWRHVP